MSDEKQDIVERLANLASGFPKVDGTNDILDAIDQIAWLRNALRDCADDLEGEIRRRHGSVAPDKYEDMMVRFTKDMEPVVRARAALTAARTGE